MVNNFNIMRNLKRYKNGNWSSVFVCYYLSLLPIIVSFFYMIFHLFDATHLKFLYIHLQYSYLLILFPLLFIMIDLTRIIKGKYKFRFSFKTLFTTYPETLLFLGVILWILISSFSRVIIGVYPSGFEANASSIYSLEQGFPFYLFYAMCFVFAFSLKSRKIAENITLSMIICSTIFVIFSLIDPTGKLSFQSLGNTNWCSVFLNSNIYGYFLSMTTILCFAWFMLKTEKTIKYLLLSSGILHLVVVFMNNSLACMLSIFITLIVCIIVFSIHKRKFDWQYLLPIVIFVALSQICTLFAHHYYSKYQNFFGQLINMCCEFFGLIYAPLDPATASFGTGRAELWLNSLKEIFENNPIWGNGNTYSQPHSEYLQLAEIWGLPCLTFYIVAFIIVFVKHLKNLRHLSPLSLVLFSSVLCYLISACFGNIMPHIAPYFIMLSAMLVRWLNVDINKAKLQKEIKTEGIIITDNNILN